MDKEVLLENLFDINEDSTVFIDMSTPVKLKGGKKNPLQGKVTKHTTNMEVKIPYHNASSYVKTVRSRLVEEGKDVTAFELGKRAWGTRVDDTPIIKHNDAFYLEVFPVDHGSVYYMNDDTGELMNPDDIEGLETKAEPKEDSQGGLENKLIVRSINVENINYIRIEDE